MIGPSRSTMEAYNRRLRRRHPFVRLRFSEYRGVFVLEERVGRSRPLDPDDYPESRADAYIQDRDGYATIEYLRLLPSVVRLSDALEAARITTAMRLAGVTDASEWADRYDARDAARGERDVEKFTEAVGEVASEEYDRAMWRTGSRA